MFALSSCARGPLADTPIVGGTYEARAWVRGELAAFDEATGGGRARVSKVRLRPLDGVGWFDPVSHSISLDESLPPEGLVQMLRHELCHALDVAEGPLFREREALYRRLADGVFSDDTWLVEGAEVPRSQRDRQREVFAAFCSVGPWVAHAASGTCPGRGEDEDAARVMSHLSERVWSAFDGWRPSEEGPIWAQIELDAPPVWVDAEGTVEPGVFSLTTDPGGTAYRDVRTGAAVERATRAGEPWALPPGIPEPLEIDDAVGWPGGPAAVSVSLSLYHLGEETRRVWSDGERWSLLGDGCGELSPFALDDRIFTLRPSGARVAWGPAE